MRLKCFTAHCKRWSPHKSEDILGFRVVGFLSVLLLISTGCVEPYRAVAPITRPSPSLHYPPGLVIVEFDQYGVPLIYGLLLSYPTITTDSIVGIDASIGTRRGVPLARITRVRTRERYIIDKLVSLRLGSPPVPIDSRYKDAAGFMEITVRR